MPRLTTSLLLVLLLSSCDGDGPVAPSTTSSILVTWPFAGDNYYMGDGLRIKWEASQDIGRVSIIMRRVDGSFGDTADGVLMFSALPGKEVLWREWWEHPLDIQEGIYVFRVEATDTLSVGEIYGESGAINFIRRWRQ